MLESVHMGSLRTIEHEGGVVFFGMGRVGVCCVGIVDVCITKTRHAIRRELTDHWDMGSLPTFYASRPELLATKRKGAVNDRHSS